MAAIFFTPTDGKNVFKGGLQVNTSISIPFLRNLIGPASNLIVTDVSVQNSDTVQFFLTFDDFISWFYFGKGLGQLAIRGMILEDCNGNLPGVNTLYQAIGDIRGTEQLVSFGNIVFTGVLTNFTTTVSSDIVNAANFELSLQIVNHSLPTKRFYTIC